MSFRKTVIYDIEIHDIYNNITKKIDMHEYETIYQLQCKISQYFNIPIDYQLLMTKKYVIYTHLLYKAIPIDVDIDNLHIEISKNTDIKYHEKVQIIDKTNVILTGESLYVISLMDVMSMGDIDNFILYLTENDLRNLIDYKLKKYWPRVTYNAFYNLIYNRKPSNIITNVEAVFDNSIFDIDDIDNCMIIDDKEIMEVSYITYYTNPISMEFIYNQFNTNEKYNTLIYRISGVKYLEKKYKIKSKINYKYNKLYPSIKIQNKLLIYSNYIKYTDIILYKKIHKLIEKNNVIFTKKMSKFYYNILLNNKLNFMKFTQLLQNKYYNVLSRNPLNLDNNIYYVGTFKDPCYYDIENIHHVENHKLMIRWNTQDRVKLIMTTNDISIDKYINLIVRILYSAINHKVPIDKYVIPLKMKGDFTLIDPILYKHQGDDIPKFKIYSRKVSRLRQPIIFLNGSKILKIYLTRLREHNIKYNTLKYKNFTYVNKKSIYICSNKNNTHCSFISPNLHQFNLCQVFCGAKHPNTKGELYTRCIKGSPFIVQHIVKTEEDIINKYYVKTYNPLRMLNKSKFSMLPKKINTFFNGAAKLVINNYIINNRSTYLLYGMNYESMFDAITRLEEYFIGQKSETYNLSLGNLYKNKYLFLSIFNDRDGVYHFRSYMSMGSYEYGFKNNYKILFVYQSNRYIYEVNIFQTNHIAYISNLKNNKYNVKYYIDSDDDVYEKIYMLFSKMVDVYHMGSRNYFDLSQYKHNEIVQLCILDINLTIRIYIKKYDIILPIIPHLASELHPKENYVTYDIFKINTREKISKWLDHQNINISTYLYTKDGKNLGVELDNKFIILYKKTNKYKKQDKGNMKLYSYVTRNAPLSKKFVEKTISTYDNISLNIEKYWIFVYHVIDYVNRIKIDINDINVLKLKNFWGDSEYLHEDLRLYRLGRYKYMKYIYKLKWDLFTHKSNIQYSIDLIKKNVVKKIIIVDNIDQKIDSKINIRTLCPSKMATITDQCENEKFILTQEQFDLYTDIFAIELKFNIRRQREFIMNTPKKIIKVDGIKRNIAYRAGIIAS